MTPDDVGLPAIFVPFADEFPTTGHAVDVACGRGLTAIWLARRGMSVTGYDVSPVAIAAATELAAQCGVSQLCRFQVVDLDDGLPPGRELDVIVCHKFRDHRLDRPMLVRLAAGGLLAISALRGAGAFRVADGELEEAFADLAVTASGTADDTAWLLGRR
ncbi:MAG: methyltransferase domain-containing protein [Mycobacterium sp.]